MGTVSSVDVQNAFQRIRSDGLPQGNGASTKWDALDPQTGERFPPKAILAVAKQLAHDDSPSGGGGWPTNDRLAQLGIEVVLKPHLEQSEELQDIEAVFGSNEPEATKRRLVNARLGQGGFREALIERWQARCALTMLDVEPALRASHIKPWRDSDDRERLDPANGLLLAASVDALFDRYLISFANDGSLLVDPSISENALRKIGLAAGSRIELPAASTNYMRHHRKRFETDGL